jgi:hypothetical protein
MAECSIAVFDLGGVPIDWNPRYLYRKLFDGDTEAMEEFLATVCTQSWNEQQDAGRSFADDCAGGKMRTLKALLSCVVYAPNQHLPKSDPRRFSLLR